MSNLKSFLLTKIPGKHEFELSIVASGKSVALNQELTLKEVREHFWDGNGDLVLFFKEAAWVRLSQIAFVYQLWWWQWHTATSLCLRTSFPLHSCLRLSHFHTHSCSHGHLQRIKNLNHTTDWKLKETESGHKFMSKPEVAVSEMWNHWKFETSAMGW